MSSSKPSIYDTTSFELTITGLDKNTPTLVGVATGFTDTVYVVEWTLTATEGSDSVDIQGSTQLEAPNSSNFTAFGSLTHDVVKGWVTSHSDFLNNKYACCNNILNQRSARSETINITVPWS